MICRDWLAEIDHLLLPVTHPVYPALAALLTSPAALSEEGFVRHPEAEGEPLLFTHPQIEGYLLKGYLPGAVDVERLERLVDRVKLAAKIRDFLAREKIDSIAVQDEWLYRVASLYLIVGCQLEKAPAGYCHLSPRSIWELVRLAKYLNGLAVGPLSLPLTVQGKLLILNPLLRCGGFRCSMAQFVAHLPPDLRGIAEIRIEEADRPQLAGSLAERYLALASEFALPPETPLYERAIALLRKGEGFERIVSYAGGEARVRHPELEGHDLLLLTKEREEVAHFLPLFTAYRDLIEFSQSHRIDLIAIPKAWMLLWWDEGQRAAALIESVESLTEKESIERYERLSESELYQLLVLWARFRSLILTPALAPALPDGRISISLEQLRRRRVGELSLSLLPYLPEDRQGKVLEKWGELLRRAEPQLRQPPYQIAVDRYLLPPNHPLQGRLRELFSSPDDFIDRGTMRCAGFEFDHWTAEAHLDRICVASHPLIQGYLIKSYPLLGDPLDHYRYRLRNYIKRIEGANAIRDYIHRSGSPHLVVPGKWLYRLPDNFSTQVTPYGKFVLVVERLDLLSYQEGIDRFRNLSLDLLEELLRMLIATRLGDLALRNLPWTRDERIALVDTELFGSTASHLIREVIATLRPELQEEAERLWILLTNGG